MLRVVAALALVLGVTGCSGGDGADEAAGYQTPSAAVRAWLTGLSTMDFEAIEEVTDPVDIALVAAAENQFTAEQLAAVAESGLPSATLRSYWQTFGAELVSMAGASPDGLAVGEGEVFEHDGTEFAGVPVGPPDAGTQIVARRAPEGWLVDLTATAGPVLAIQLRRILSMLGDEAEPDVSRIYAAHAVSSLGAALALAPDDRALDLELEAIADLHLHD